MRFRRRLSTQADTVALDRTPAMPAPKPQVLVRFGIVLLRVPRYLRLAYGLARDQRLSTGQRALAVGGAAYLISPIDPVPGFIPVLGQLDDLAVLLLTLRRTLQGCPPTLVAEHLERAGLSLVTLDADLATVRATAVWVAVKAGTAVGRATGYLARAGTRQLDSALGRWRSRGARGR